MLSRRNVLTLFLLATLAYNVAAVLEKTVVSDVPVGELSVGEIEDKLQVSVSSYADFINRGSPINSITCKACKM